MLPFVSIVIYFVFLIKSKRKKESESESEVPRAGSPVGQHLNVYPAGGERCDVTPYSGKGLRALWKNGSQRWSHIKGHSCVFRCAKDAELAGNLRFLRRSGDTAAVLPQCELAWRSCHERLSKDCGSGPCVNGFHGGKFCDKVRK